MIDIDVKIKNLKRAQRQMGDMAEAGKDVRPIWEDFLDAFKVYVDQKWSEQGHNWGKRWKGLSDNYKKWKRVNYGTAKANLQLTGKLRRAATGSKVDGWFQEIKQTSARWGIRGIPYASIHQFGGKTGKATMPQRPYFMDIDGLLPGELLQALFDVTDMYFKDNM
jgi:phage gpG-like protein